jgi:hypothetical protein
MAAEVPLPHSVNNLVPCVISLNIKNNSFVMCDVSMMLRSK